MWLPHYYCNSCESRCGLWSSVLNKHQGRLIREQLWGTCHMASCTVPHNLGKKVIAASLSSRPQWHLYSLVPRFPDHFNVHEKRGGGPWDPTSRDKCWHDSIKERWSTTVDFKLVHQLQFIKHSSLRPPRILLCSHECFVVISSIRNKLKHLNI